MKILHIGKYYPPYMGGIEKVTFDCVEGLNKEGYRTDVFCFNDKNKTEVENKNNYSIFRMSRIIEKFSTPISFSFYFKLRKVIKNYDLVHIHLPNPIAAIFLQLTNYKGKIVLHWHSDIVKQKLLKTLYRPFQTRLLKRADKIIVTTPNYLKGSEDLSDYHAKCEVLPIGINKDELQSDPVFLKQLHEQFKNKKVIFSIGRLTYYKGFDYLIKAAKYIPEDSIILIGGAGELHEELSKLIKEEKVETKVKLLGKIPFNQLSSYYQRADIFCLPSIEKSEAFGVVLIEAMSFGCPIIACNIEGSGVNWVNENKVTGLNVKPKSEKAISDAIDSILKDEEKMIQFSQNAIQRYSSRFQLMDMVATLIKIYKKT